jgi:hypothetical protein
VVTRLVDVAARVAPDRGWLAGSEEGGAEMDPRNHDGAQFCGSSTSAR